MKLVDMVRSTYWVNIKQTLLALYPDQSEMLDEYQNVFESLKILEPEESDMQIVLTDHAVDPTAENNEEKWVEVSGWTDSQDENGRPIGFALEFTAWKNWMGMKITSETLRHFSETEIMAHCLYEMTFTGFDEEKIQEERKALEKQIEELNSLTEEEREQRTFSMDELKKWLEEE